MLVVLDVELDNDDTTDFCLTDIVMSGPGGSLIPVCDEVCQ